MKRYQISSVLAVILMTLLMFPARAAGVALETSDTKGAVELTLTGLEEEYCGIQITVAVDGSANVSFALDEGLSDPGRGVYCTRKDGDDGNVTIYIVARSPLNAGSDLTLGALTGEGASSVSMVSCKLLTTALEGELLDLEDSSGPSGTDQGTSSGPSGTNPGTSSQPSETNPGTSSQPSETNPGTSSQPSGTNPGTSSQPSGTNPGTSSQPSGTNPGTSSRPSGTEPAEPSNPSGGQEVPPSEDPSLSEALPFPDVAPGWWYYEAVAYVYHADLMRGMDDGTFQPEGITTRAQLVTILHRLEGEPPPLTSSGFADVPDGLWCAPAVSWAAENKIVEGYSGNRFGPGDGISREQMAAILYRYIRYRNGDISARGDLSVFPDADDISGWTGAVEAMEWAVGTGLIAGRDGLLDPQGTATRAQMATILMRFCENILQ